MELDPCNLIKGTAGMIDTWAKTKKEIEGKDVSERHLAMVRTKLEEAELLASRILSEPQTDEGAEPALKRP